MGVKFDNETTSWLLSAGFVSINRYDGKINEGAAVLLGSDYVARYMHKKETDKYARAFERARSIIAALYIGGTMSIARFPQTQIYDSDAKIVNFAAYVGEKTISCYISIEALQDHFQGNLLKPLQAFICNRPAIEQITERLIAQQRFEADGCSILIRSEDC